MGRTKDMAGEMANKRLMKTTLQTDGLVGVIVEYELDERLWEFQGFFDGKNVYKRKIKKQFKNENN